MQIRINQVKIPIACDSENYRKEKVAKMLRLRPDQIRDLTILRKSIDARKKESLCYVYSLVLDLDLPAKKAQRLFQDSNIAAYHPVIYRISDAGDKNIQPIIIGFGPAGLFAAYSMCLAGQRPLVFERGRSVRERTEDIAAYWRDGLLKPDSNVQFGEGGAGTFSDGKLNTQINDRDGRNTFVLETFVKYGAQESILYDSKPHIGTDFLVQVIENMRNDMIRMGADIRFQSQITDLAVSETADQMPQITSLTVNDAYQVDAKGRPVVLAIGHSARDTFAMLYKHKVPMTAKEFAVGFRVEHSQQAINTVQYGTDQLGAAPYKLTYRSPSGRSVYSFCMCPGGYVVDSSSEPGGLCVNGMSYSDRGSDNANSAIVVSVGKGEFDMTDPMAGIAYQRKIEQEAYALGGGRIPQQLYGDFRQDKPSDRYETVTSCHKGRASFANLRHVYSEEINTAFMEGMADFARHIPDFDSDAAVLSGVESRTSSPVRIMRDENFHSAISNLYPCGEGAGYAGGITSAAMDGLKVAEAIINKERGSYV